MTCRDPRPFVRTTAMATQNYYGWHEWYPGRILGSQLKRITRKTTVLTWFQTIRSRCWKRIRVTSYQEKNCEERKLFSKAWLIIKLPKGLANAPSSRSIQSATINSTLVAIYFPAMYLPNFNNAKRDTLRYAHPEYCHVTTHSGLRASFHRGLHEMRNPIQYIITTVRACNHSTT